jgi:hypothetical protein
LEEKNSLNNLRGKTTSVEQKTLQVVGGEKKEVVLIVVTNTKTEIKAT